jgi:hypothetical protein
MDNENVNFIEQKREAARKAAGGMGDVMVVETDVPGAELAAFRVPNSMEWLRYRTATNSGPAEKAAAAKPLVCCCRVYPDAAEFDAILAAHPGLVETYINELVEHAGVGRAKKVSKL